MPIPESKSISIFLLCFNDAKTIGKLAQEALNIAQGLFLDYEVIVVNDGSTDNSRCILEALARENNKLRIIHHEKNMGYGAAVKTGLSSAVKDLVFYTDGDGQYDVREIKKLLGLINQADMVNGFLYKRRDPFYRIILGKIYSRLIYILFRIPLRYVDCDFRLFHRHVIQNLELESSGGFICAELIMKVLDKGYAIKEISIQHYPRLSGKSEFFKIRNVAKLCFDCINFYLKRKP